MALVVHEDAVGVANGEVWFLADVISDKRVELLNFFGVVCVGAAIGAGHGFANDNLEVGVEFFDGREDCLDVVGDVRRVFVVADIIGADEDDDGGGFEVQHVGLQPVKDAAGDVATDAAVGDFQVGKILGEGMPAFGDGIAEEDDGADVIGGIGLPLGMVAGPDPGEAGPDIRGHLAGQMVTAGKLGNISRRRGRGVLCGSGKNDGDGEQEYQRQSGSAETSLAVEQMGFHKGKLWQQTGPNNGKLAVKNLSLVIGATGGDKLAESCKVLRLDGSRVFRRD